MDLDSTPYRPKEKEGPRSERPRSRISSFHVIPSSYTPPPRPSSSAPLQPNSSVSISLPHDISIEVGGGAPHKHLFDVRHESLYVAPRLLRGQRTVSSATWVCDLGPVELIYVPEVVHQLQVPPPLPRPLILSRSFSLGVRSIST